MNKINILVLDDEVKITERLAKYLNKKGFTVYTANTPGTAFSIIKSSKIDIMISDILLPEMNGLDVLRKIKQDHQEIEVIMISGHGDMDTVIDAIRGGAVDYIRKPFGPLDVQLAIERTAKYIEVFNKLHTVESKLEKVENQKSLIDRELEHLIDKEFIGDSKAIRKVLELALIAAEDSEISVLINGENGTGKEIIARIIHYASNRRKNGFYPVNSAAIPEHLLESEFFGHVKGAFTGANENKKGCFELANGGTLFLDEIADMPMMLQSKLLRALEENQIKPVGSTHEIKVNVRVISATNKNIEEMIADNQFRIDLFHRINTLIIEIPPLRERKEDIEPLLKHFAGQISRRKNKPVPKISAELIKQLQNYTFPGNVRELKNMVERALILSSKNILDVKDFTFATQPTPNTNSLTSLNLADMEIDAIKNALQHTSFNQVKAASLLGISNDALARRIKKYNIKIHKDIF